MARPDGGSPAGISAARPRGQAAWPGRFHRDGIGWLDRHGGALAPLSGGAASLGGHAHQRGDPGKERVELAIRELERTRAQEREILAVVTVTGTGWVDPDAAETVEHASG
jgi:hypothetical protein